MITGQIKLDLIPSDNLCGHKINVLHSQCHLYQNQSCGGQVGELRIDDKISLQFKSGGGEGIQS